MVQSLARGIEILSVIQERGSATIVEVASVLGVNKDTISRPMATLMHYDMASTDPASKKYRLGFWNLYLSKGIKKNFSVAVVARPYLYKICDGTKESIHLVAVRNRKTYTVDQARNQREYNLSAQIGVIEAWYCSTVGKCVLAYKSSSLIEDILRDYDFGYYTSNTITTYQNLEKELKEIRRQGHTLDDEEHALGVRYLAVPVFNYSGNVSCCVGISAPRGRITEATVKKCTLRMKKYGSQISKELGYGLYRNQDMLWKQKQKRVFNVSNFMDKFSLASRKIIVTGGTKGLRNGIAQALHDAGAGVVLLDILDAIEDSAGGMAKKGPTVCAAGSNLTKTGELGNMYNECLENLGGRVGILLDGTDIQFRIPAVDLPHDHWERIITPNINAIFYMSQLTSKTMLAQKYGKIVSIASVTVFFTSVLILAHSASKGGTAQITKVLSSEQAGRDVNINTIAPGYMATELTANTKEVSPEQYGEITSRILAGRWGRMEDLQRLTIFLASDALAYTSGAVTPVDGGSIGKQKASSWPSCISWAYV